jgi:hypothetical protein
VRVVAERAERQPQATLQGGFDVLTVEEAEAPRRRHGHLVA